MLTCIRKGFDLVKQHYNRQLTLANVPEDDSTVYDMICEADTLGVFQIESRAQMSALPRTRPKCFAAGYEPSPVSRIRDQVALLSTLRLLNQVHQTAIAVFLDGDDYAADPTSPDYRAG